MQDDISGCSLVTSSWPFSSLGPESGSSGKIRSRAEVPVMVDRIDWIVLAIICKETLEGFYRASRGANERADCIL